MMGDLCKEKASKNENKNAHQRLSTLWPGSDQRVCPDDVFQVVLECSFQGFFVINLRAIPTKRLGGHRVAL